jgi:hypothetical protein
MKTAFFVVLLVLIIGEEANSKADTAACPSNYDPVCGISKHGIKKNYNNSCLAENDNATDVTRGFCVRSRKKQKT